MKFNIGDRVRFLNDVGGGKVVKYIDNETVAVLNQDDFEIPVLMSELILDQAPDYASSGNSSETQGTVSQSGEFNIRTTGTRRRLCEGRRYNCCFSGLCS
jgi:hypothetical protein